MAKRSRAVQKFEERKLQQSREATIAALGEAAQDFVLGVAGHLDPPVAIAALTIRAILKFAGTVVDAQTLVALETLQSNKLALASKLRIAEETLGVLRGEIELLGKMLDSPGMTQYERSQIRRRLREVSARAEAVDVRHTEFCRELIAKNEETKAKHRLGTNYVAVKVAGATCLVVWAVVVVWWSGGLAAPVGGKMLVAGASLLA